MLKLKNLPMRSRLYIGFFVCAFVGAVGGVVGITALAMIQREMADINSSVSESIHRQTQVSQHAAELRETSHAAESVSTSKGLDGIVARIRSQKNSTPTTDQAELAGVAALETFGASRMEFLKSREKLEAIQSDCRALLEELNAAANREAKLVQEQTLQGLNKDTTRMRESAATSSEVGNVAFEKLGAITGKAQEAIRSALTVRTCCMELNGWFMVCNDPLYREEAQKRIPPALALAKTEVKNLPQTAEAELINKTLYQMDYYVNKVNEQQRECDVALKEFETTFAEFETLRASLRADSANASSATLSALSKVDEIALTVRYSREVAVLLKTMEIQEQSKEALTSLASAEKAQASLTTAREKKLAYSATNSELEATMKAVRAALGAIGGSLDALSGKTIAGAKTEILGATSRFKEQTTASRAETEKSLSEFSNRTSGALNVLNGCLTLRALAKEQMIALNSILQARDFAGVDTALKSAVELKSETENLAGSMNSVEIKRLASLMAKLSAATAGAAEVKRTEIASKESEEKSAAQLGAGLSALDKSMLDSSALLKQNCDTVLANSAISVGRWQILVLVLCAIAFGVSMAIGWRVAKNVNSLIDEVRAASEVVDLKAGEIRGLSGGLSEACSAQAASLEETTATMTEIRSRTEQTATGALSACDLARESRKAAANGIERVRLMLQSMEEMKTASKKIGGIIKVIDEIAFQTNLLALNAAVEAARAGDHGRGFAVVADEVRTLATRSAGAARETAELIAHTAKTVQGGQVRATESARAFEHISGDVDKIALVLDEVAAGCKSQAISIEQVSEGLAQIDSATQSNSAASEESAASAADLANSASKLRDTVKTFSHEPSRDVSIQEAAQQMKRGIASQSCTERNRIGI